MARAAGQHEPAAEAIATEKRGEIQEVAANLAAGGGGRQESHVAGQRAEIARVAGEPPSSASARSHWARSGGSARGSRIIAYAVAWPMVVSPATVSI
jgi:hypothetical protein